MTSLQSILLKRIEEKKTMVVTALSGGFERGSEHMYDRHVGNIRGLNQAMEIICEVFKELNVNDNEEDDDYAE